MPQASAEDIGLGPGLGASEADVEAAISENETPSNVSTANPYENVLLNDAELTDILHQEAAKAVEEYNDSFWGKVGGFFGITKSMDTVIPGQTNMNLEVSLPGILAGLVAGPAAGLIVGKAANAFDLGSKSVELDGILGGVKGTNEEGGLNLDDLSLPGDSDAVAPESSVDSAIADNAAEQELDPYEKIQEEFDSKRDGVFFEFPTIESVLARLKG